MGCVFRVSVTFLRALSLRPLMYAYSYGLYLFQCPDDSCTVIHEVIFLVLMAVYEINVSNISALFTSEVFVGNVDKSKHKHLFSGPGLHGD